VRKGKYLDSRYCTAPVFSFQDAQDIEGGATLTQSVQDHEGLQVPQAAGTLLVLRKLRTQMQQLAGPAPCMSWVAAKHTDSRRLANEVARNSMSRDRGASQRLCGEEEGKRGGTGQKYMAPKYARRGNSGRGARVCKRLGFQLLTKLGRGVLGHLHLHRRTIAVHDNNYQVMVATRWNRWRGKRSE
jgi:hypothetical protein